MWAMMPMLRTRSIGICLAISIHQIPRARIYRTQWSGRQGRLLRGRNLIAARLGSHRLISNYVGPETRRTRGTGAEVRAAMPLPNRPWALPAEMRESLVGLRHLVGVFLLLDGRAF